MTIHTVRVYQRRFSFRRRFLSIVSVPSLIWKHLTSVHPWSNHYWLRDSSSTLLALADFPNGYRCQAKYIPGCSGSIKSWANVGHIHVSVHLTRNTTGSSWIILFARHAVIRSGNRENILIDRDVEWKKNAHCESTKGLRMRLAVKNRQNDFWDCNKFSHLQPSVIKLFFFLSEIT